jgi:hypothetical protein
VPSENLILFARQQTLCKTTVNLSLSLLHSLFLYLDEEAAEECRIENGKQKAR